MATRGTESGLPLILLVCFCCGIDTCLMGGDLGVALRDLGPQCFTGGRLHAGVS